MFSQYSDHTTVNGMHQGPARVPQSKLNIGTVLSECFTDSSCIQSLWMCVVCALLEPFTSLRMARSCEEIRQLLADIAVPSSPVSQSLLGELKAWVCGIRTHQADTLIDFIRLHRGQPILCSYSSDATPQSVAYRIHRPSVAGSVQRSGRTTSDYLMQRASYKSCNSHGSVDVAILTHPPVPLSEGKKRWNVLKAYMLFAPTMKELGHDGFSIHHFCFDRGFAHSLDRAIIQELHQRHASRLEVSPGLIVHDLPTDMAVLSSHCCCHAVHNAVKWSLGLADREETGKQLWVIVTNIRSSYMELHGAIMEFLSSTCVFGVHAWVMSPAEATELYTFLGVPPDLLDLYIQLQPTYVAGRLYVSSPEDDADLVDEHLVTLLLHALRFVGHSDSRWCSLGESSRCLLLAMHLGLHGLITLAQKSKKSQYCLAGAECLESGAFRGFIVEAALVTSSPDAALSLMLDDDRLLLVKDRLVDSMRVEMRYLEEASVKVWRRFANIADDGRSWACLRSDILSMLHIAHAYIQEHVLRPLESYPWRLGEPNAMHDLGRLTSAPEEPFASRVYYLMQEGCPEPQGSPHFLALIFMSGNSVPSRFPIENTGLTLMQFPLAFKHVLNLGLNHQEPFSVVGRAHLLPIQTRAHTGPNHNSLPSPRCQPTASGGGFAACAAGVVQHHGCGAGSCLPGHHIQVSPAAQ